MASDRRGGVVHPLVYPHPLTGKSTLCFHLGMTDHYIYDYGGPNVINGIKESSCHLDDDKVCLFSRRFL